MDPESLRALGLRFWYAWGAAMLVGAAAVVGGTAVVGPEGGWLVATYGLLALLFLGFCVVAAAQADYLDAAGMAVAAVGMTVLATAATAGYPGNWLWIGFGLGALGGGIGLWADHGHRVRATLAN